MARKARPWALTHQPSPLYHQVQTGPRHPATPRLPTSARLQVCRPRTSCLARRVGRPGTPTPRQATTKAVTVTQHPSFTLLCGLRRPRGGRRGSEERAWSVEIRCVHAKGGKKGRVGVRGAGFVSEK